MTHEDWADQEGTDLNEAVEGDHHRSARGRSVDGWQMAGVFLLSVLISPVLVTRTSQDWAEGLGSILVSSPLLAWLLIPLRRTDDLFDEANRKRAELIDTLAVVLIWSWPLTCCFPLAAVVRYIGMLVPRGL